MLHLLKWKGYSKSSKCCLPTIFVVTWLMTIQWSRESVLWEWQDCKGACKRWLFSHPTPPPWIKYQQEISGSSYHWSISDKVFLFQTKIYFLSVPFIPDCTVENLTPHNKIFHKWQCPPTPWDIRGYCQWYYVNLTMLWSGMCFLNLWAPEMECHCVAKKKPIN